MQRYLYYFLPLLFMLNATVPAQGWPWIFDSGQNSWADMARLQEAMGQSQVVVVGEQHDHAIGHQVECELLDIFWQTHGDVAVALEMFERDVQHIVDGYLEGEVSERFFLANSRPWKNYSSAYRPLVEFAKDLSLPVLAMNVPRRYAAHVTSGKEKILAELPAADKKFLAEIVVPSGAYREKFVKTMQGHAKPEEMERYYRAQCFKDDTMARALAEMRQKRPATRIIAYVGAFHCEERLGVPQKLLAQLPQTRVLVICIIPVSGRPEHPENYRQQADFLLFAPEYH
jgi:uncharacterized iron-regulated protein